MELTLIGLMLAVIFASLTLMGYFDKPKQPYKEWWIAEAAKVLRKNTKYNGDWCKGYAETLFEKMMQGLGVS